MKFSTSGSVVWTKSIANAYVWEVGNSVIRTNDGGYAIIGSVDYEWYRKIFLIKTDSSGNSVPLIGVGMNEMSSNNTFAVFPNPASQKINVFVNGNFGTIMKLEIFDCIGQLRFLKSSSFENIDINSLSSDIYFIVLTNHNNERLISKLIKE